MIVYEFDIPNFFTAEGDARFQVVDGKLELENEPGDALKALIEKFGGKLVEQKKRTKKSSAKNKDSE